MEQICFLDAALLMSLPASSSSTPPSTPISLPLVSHIKTIPEDDESIVYNCTFSMEDLDSPPLSKRSWEWISKVASSWNKEDEVDVYRSDKDMTDFYDQYMKDPRYVAFPMIAASLFPLPLPMHSYAMLSRVDQIYMHVSGSNTTMDISCVHLLRDKCNHYKLKLQWILDSNASMHFSPKRDDFAEYTIFPKKDHIPAHTAASNIHVIGIGKCIVPWRDSNRSLQHLMLVGIGHIPNSGVHLVSMDQLLASGTTVQGNRTSICMLYGDGSLLAPFTPSPHFGHNMYTLEVASPQHKAHMITYDIMHKQLGYSSKNVLKYVCDYMCNFPSSIEFPKKDTICPGCMKGKMPACTYHPDSHCTSKPFELIHLDIKSFPILSYHKYLL